MYYNSLSKQDLSIIIGNIVEHFDTALYVFLAPVLAGVFFDSADSVTALIKTYAVLATSIITKPFGAIIFGIIARNYGPTLALTYSILGIALSTTTIAILPSYASLGWVATLLLVVIRMLQGVFAIGEATIASLYLADKVYYYKAFKSSYLYQASSLFGIISASITANIIIAVHQNYIYLWRLCFLLGGIIAIIGYIIRRYSNLNINIHNALLPSYPYSFFVDLLKHRVAILQVIVLSGFSYVTYSIASIFMNSFIPLITDVEISDMMLLNTHLLILDMLLVFIFGRTIKCYNAKKICLFAASLFGLTIIPLWYGLNNSTLQYITFVRFIIIILGVIFSLPLSIIFNDMTQSPNKYAIIGLGTALGNSIIGHTAPFVCMTLWSYMGSYLAIAYYLCFITLLALCALMFLHIK